MRSSAKRTHHSSTIIIVLVAVTIAAFIAWSFWARLDQISRARGQVIPAGRVQIIQSLDGGEITKILVREGDSVRRGQLLLVLDKVKLAAAAEEARAQVAALRATMTRVQAELLNKPLLFPADVRAYPEFVQNQQTLYNERRSALNAQLAGIRSQQRLQEQELDLNKPLVTTGDVAQSEVIRMQRMAADLGTQAEVQRGRYIQDLQAEFTKTQGDLVTAEQVLTQRQDALKNAEFRSPADGVVKNVRLTTVGGVFRPGDEVMTIVPTGDRLIVEAKVSPSDIAYVKPGQSASVKFDAYDSSIYGAGEGKVTFISPDTMSEQGPDGKAEAPYYRVHLTVDTSRMHPHYPGEKIEIQPGMTATAEIRTGESTVFRYLTKPILKTASESMGER